MSNPTDILATMPPAPDPLTHPVSAALATSHAPFALRHGRASKYPATMAPFAALQQASPDASADLYALLVPGETVFLETSVSPHPDLTEGTPVPCVQMHFPAHAPLPSPTRLPSPLAIVPLTCADAPAMLALIAVAYPGYFRPETCRMGRYFGVWESPARGTQTSERTGEQASTQPDEPVCRRLLGMVGERLIAAPYREISALAVDPAAAGRGLGTALLGHMLALHRAERSHSWLFATIENTRAITLYEHLGFEHTRRIDLRRFTRTG